MSKDIKHIGIFMSFSGDGGVEKMIANLCQGLLDAGIRVDLVLARAKGRHLSSIPHGVRLFKLGANHTFSALPGLVSYLQREKPSSLLAAKDRAIKVAVMARWLARSKVPLVGRLGTTVSTALEDKHAMRRALWYAGMRLFYSRTDGIVAVSQGVADDLRKITGLPESRIKVIRNPVITPAIFELAKKETAHDWLSDPDTPVIIGMGRLTTQKDFPTLLRAFAHARKSIPARLIILGEGGDRKKLQDLAVELNVSEDVELPGFQKNPYAFLSRCALFVLSSRWEGSPNALTESLALGTPVVSTDCPSGPREILAEGHYGKLVPVGDYKALAQAMISTLENPLPEYVLKEAVKKYSLENSVNCYLESLGFK